MLQQIVHDEDLDDGAVGHSQNTDPDQCEDPSDFAKVSKFLARGPNLLLCTTRKEILRTVSERCPSYSKLIKLLESVCFIPTMTHFEDCWDEHGMQSAKVNGSWTTLRRAHLPSHDVWKYVNFHPQENKPTTAAMVQSHE